MATRAADVARLAALFTCTQARAAGISRSGSTPIAPRGSSIRLPAGCSWADASEVDQDLLEIAQRAPRGALCLITALARHGLTDMIPPRVDIALPRGSRVPTLRKSVDVHVMATHFHGAERAVREALEIVL